MKEAVDAVIQQILTLPVKDFNRDKTEASVRCPFCLDSIKSGKSTHFYIKLNVSDDEPIVFHCQRCKVEGILNSDILKMLNLYDYDTSVLLKVKNKNISKANKKKFAALKPKEMILNVPERTKLNLTKLNYINNRLGIDLKLSDLPKFKINLNLYDMLDDNEIENLTVKSERFGDTLDKYFLGFVSHDCNFTIMRNLSKKVMPDMRYHIYNNFGSFGNIKRFYTLPNKIDILKSDLNVVITEGCFDLLGVYFNVRNREMNDNTLYISVNGVGYHYIFLYLMKLGFLNIHAHVYSDNDQPKSMFEKIKRIMPQLFDSFTVYYNDFPNEKDFGVRKEKIKLIKTKI